MTLIIEVYQLKSNISPRKTPFYKVHSVYANKVLALDAIYDIQQDYHIRNIKSSFNEDILVISDVPERGFANISYIIEDTMLYGDSIGDYVYNLIMFQGYILDQDKPYRYTNLGWFSNPIWAKRTREWRLMKYAIETRKDIDWIETNNEIRILGPNECTDRNPSLVIRSYPLIK